MKKIIFCVTNDINYDQRMQRICSCLQEEGFDVTLVGRLKKDSKPLSEFSFKTVRLKCQFEKGKLFYIEYNIRLLSYLLSSTFDIAGAVDLDTIKPVWLASKYKHAKSTFDAHEYFEEVPEVTSRPLTKWIWKLVGDFYIPKMNACYTVGKSLADLFSRKYKVPFSLVRNMPVLKDRAVVNAPLIAQPYILYQGALNEGRGLEQMIRAMKELPQYRLLLAGEGDLSQSLRNLTNVLGLTDRIIFLGYLKPSELDNYTAGAYVGLNLLENKGLSYYYSLANKCFDYLQFGVPTLNMDFPEYRALNQEYEIGLLLSSLKKEELVTSLNLLFNDIQLHHRLRDNCLKARLEWNWENEKQNLIKIYKELTI